ncbi:MAG TPA: hypothetical protein PK252_00420 [Bacteroidales bacterium]|nr:hypothetical protein [Bacteroidales bacterium]
MKTLKKSAFIALFVFISLSITAQGFPEKLILLTSSDVKMVIETREILDIPHEKKQDTLFMNLLSDISKVQDSLTRLNVPLQIFYSTMDKDSRSMKVANNAETKAEFIFKGASDTVRSNFFNYKIECDLNWNNKLILYTNNLSELGELKNTSFSDIVQQAQADIALRKIPSYKAKTCLYKINHNQLDATSADIKQQGTFIITPGMDFGLSYLNDRFMPNISMSMAYVFSPKNEKKCMLGISGEIFYNMDTAEAYKMQGNSFVDVFFHAKNPYSPIYYASDFRFFIGYLVHREGVVFPKNSWRFGLDMPAGKNFRINYVVYLNDFGSNNKNKGLFEIGIKYKFF